MAAPHVVTALIRKRAEIAGRIEHTQTALRQLIIDLDNLDATIRLFEPDIDLEEIRPKPFPPRHAAFRGEVVAGCVGCPQTVSRPSHSATDRTARHGRAWTEHGGQEAGESGREACRGLSQAPPEQGAGVVGEGIGGISGLGNLKN